MKRFVSVLCLFLALVFAGGASAERAGYFSVLLIGEDDAVKDDMNPQEAEFGRADALIIGMINLSTGEMRMLSVDRDYAIELADQGITKLCIANYFGGPEVVLEKVNELFDLEISCYAMVTKPDMGKIVTKLGGVTIDIRKQDLKPSGLRKAGKQKLSGKQVIAYMGKRNVEDLESDVARNERQRIVLSAIMDKMFSQKPADMLKTVQEVIPLVKTNVSLPDVLSLLAFIRAQEISRPLQERTPRLEDRLVKFQNFHSIVYVEDMQAEIERVKEFLYVN